MSEITDPHMVVVNDEEQYSVWPCSLPLPNGWREEGTRGSPEECLYYVGRVWTDIRPLSVRRALAARE